MRFKPKLASAHAGIDASILPPEDLIAATVDLAMMPTAQRDGKLIAHLAARGLTATVRTKQTGRAQARSLKGRQAYEQLVVLRDALLKKHEDEMPRSFMNEQGDVTTAECDDLIPLHLALFLEQKQSEQRTKTRDPNEVEVDKIAERIDERDESSTLEEAVADLIRLERYERRAWSRQKQAFREFLKLTLTAAVEDRSGRLAYEPIFDGRG